MWARVVGGWVGGGGVVAGEHGAPAGASDWRRRSWGGGRGRLPEAPCDRRLDPTAWHIGPWHMRISSSRRLRARGSGRAVPPLCASLSSRAGSLAESLGLVVVGALVLRNGHLDPCGPRIGASDLCVCVPLGELWRACRRHARPCSLLRMLREALESAGRTRWRSPPMCGAGGRRSVQHGVADATRSPARDAREMKNATGALAGRPQMCVCVWPKVPASVWSHRREGNRRSPDPAEAASAASIWPRAARGP